MDHVAMDLGAKKSQICVRGADGRILEEKRWPTADLESFLAGRPTSRVTLVRFVETETRRDKSDLVGAAPYTAVQLRTGEGAQRPTRSSAATAG